MAGRVIALEEARTAKERAKLIFRKLGHINGIGITRQGGSYAVKVNLKSSPKNNTFLPKEIDGVPVVVHIVGKIHKQFSDGSGK